jgi:glycine betaine/proline transport system substrate-binding protein
MPSQAEVRLVTIDLSFHRAASGVIRSILASHGVPVVEMIAPHEKAFEHLRDGTADMLCSAWLPDSHGVYFDPMAEQFEKVTVLYRPYAYWGVPAYVPEDVVSTIDDLRKSEAVARGSREAPLLGMDSRSSDITSRTAHSTAVSASTRKRSASASGSWSRSGNLSSCTRSMQSGN